MRYLVSRYYDVAIVVYIDAEIGRVGVLTHEEAFVQQRIIYVKALKAML